MTWTDLEGLLIGEHVNEGTAAETMRSLIKLAQARDKSLEELETRAMKLSALAFPEEVRKYTAIQVKLADLYVEVLQNEHINYQRSPGQIVSGYSSGQRQ